MPDRLQPGDRIGDATIEQALGEGGFACVYRARTDRGRPCAIKVAHETTEAMPTTELGMLHNEIEALLRLRHPGLARTHGYGYLPDGRFYLVMELVDGQPLIEYVEQHGLLDPAEALAIIERVAEVMAYCHDHGVLHLDLKPENIVITDRHGPTIKVLDFGVARLARAGRGTPRVIAGTPAYMAPECFGHAERHPSMDVYALGVTLHVMISGELAFAESGGVTALLDHKCAGPPTLDTRAWRDVPSGVRDLLRAMLAVEPDERPSMALLRSETRRQYFAALTGSSPDALGVETSFPPSQPMRTVKLLGRDASLAALRDRWAATREGERSATLVLGAQGTGKSTFIDHFLARHADGEPLVGYGRCRESGDLLPLAVIREAAGELGEKLRALPDWRSLGRELRDALGPLESVIFSLVPEAQPRDASPCVASPVPVRPQMVARAVRVLLRVVARQRPIVIVIEDLQWAAPGVLAVLEQFSREPIPGVMLLLSSREPVPWLEADAVIELGNLGAVDNDALLRGRLATEDLLVAERLRQCVPVLSAGIPMATISVTDDLLQRRCIRRRSQGVVVLNEERLRTYAPPPNVMELLLDRLRQLTPDARRVLAAGALFGRSFDMDDLFDIRDAIGSVDVRVAIMQGHHLGVLRLDGRHCWLAHDALVEPLVSTWSEADAMRIHGRIADHLAATAGDPGQWAEHLDKAGRRGDAANAHLQAARNADVLRDSSAVVHHFRRVIELGHELPPGRRRATVLGEAIFEYAREIGTVGVTDDAFAVVEQGASVIAQEGASDDSIVDSALARLHYLRGRMGPAVELSRRCLERAKDEPQTASIRVLPTNLVGRAAFIEGRFGEAAVALARGCQLAASQAEQVELCHSLGMLGLSLGFTGDAKQARTYLAEASRIAEESGSLQRVLAARCYEAIEAEFRYDWQQGVIRSAEALAFAEDHGVDGLYLVVALAYAGRHQFHMGRLQRARLLLDHAIERARRCGLESGRGWTHLFLGDVAFVEGRYDDAARYYDRGRGVAPRDWYTRAHCLIGRAHVRARSGGNRTLVHADAREALDCLEKVENVATRAHTLLRYADAIEVLDGAKAAEPWRTRADEVFSRLGVAPVDWWPSIPARDARAGTRPVDYWRARAEGRPVESDPGEAPAEEFEVLADSDIIEVVESSRIPRRLSQTDLYRMSQTLAEEARTLRGMPPRRGFGAAPRG